MRRWADRKGGTERSARTLALDPQTHRFYLASAKFEPQPEPASGAPRTRPQMIPGSMKIGLLLQRPLVLPLLPSEEGPAFRRAAMTTWSFKPRRN
jgi:hypothetical protein